MYEEMKEELLQDPPEKNHQEDPIVIHEDADQIILFEDEAEVIIFEKGGFQMPSCGVDPAALKKLISEGIVKARVVELREIINFYLWKGPKS